MYQYTLFTVYKMSLLANAAGRFLQFNTNTCT